MSYRPTRLARIILVVALCCVAPVLAAYMVFGQNDKTDPAVDHADIARQAMPHAPQASAQQAAPAPIHKVARLNDGADPAFRSPDFDISRQATLTYKVAGLKDETDPAFDTPRLDITRHAMPPPDATVKSVTDAPPQATSPKGTPADSANPLWGIPFSTLTATRDRPLFSPSRRPPPPVVAYVPVVAPPPPPPPPQHPGLTLLGTVRSETSGIAMNAAIAVFLEEGSRKATRLRTGEAHNGWVLQSVGRGAAVLQKGDAQETLHLPSPAQRAASATPWANRPPYVPGRN